MGMSLDEARDGLTALRSAEQSVAPVAVLAPLVLALRAGLAEPATQAHHEIAIAAAIIATDAIFDRDVQLGERSTSANAQTIRNWVQDIVDGSGGALHPDCIELIDAIYYARMRRPDVAAAGLTAVLESGRWQACADALERADKPLTGVHAHEAAIALRGVAELARALRLINGGRATPYLFDKLESTFESLDLCCDGADPWALYGAGLMVSYATWRIRGDVPAAQQLHDRATASRPQTPRSDLTIDLHNASSVRMEAHVLSLRDFYADAAKLRAQATRMESAALTRIRAAGFERHARSFEDDIAPEKE